MKIATFNINNINKRLHNLTSWLARGQPDIVCLQELKVEQRAFPASALRDLGYHGVWLSASNRVAQWTYGQTAAAQGLTWLRADEMVPLGPEWRHVLSV